MSCTLSPFIPSHCPDTLDAYGSLSDTTLYSHSRSSVGSKNVPGLLCVPLFDCKNGRAELSPAFACGRESHA